MARHTRSRNARGGQTIVIAAVAIALLGLVAALTIDTGQLMFARSRLQNTADASALAAAYELTKQRNDGATESAARAAAAREAAALALQNWNAARLEVRFGKYVDGHFTPMDESYTASAIQVTALRDREAPGGPLETVFARMMGIEHVNVTTRAVSQLARGITAIRGDLRPFAVHKDDLRPAGQRFRIPLGNWVQGDGDQIAPGNFGLLNLDGGASGTNELVPWILHGYDGEVSIDPTVGFTWINGTTGVRKSITDEIATLFDRMVFVCVYDTVTGTGSNANFRIVWFAGGIIRNLKFAGNNSYIELEMVRLAYVPRCELGNMPDTNLVKIQLVE
jgi:hypothetical protein